MSATRRPAKPPLSEESRRVDYLGPLAAGSLTSAALRRWQPDHLLLVGIAGGMPEEANVGDVVVPQFVASDILGKYGGDDRRTVRWVPYEIDESMLDSAMTPILTSPRRP